MISEDQAGMKRHSFAFSCFFFCFSSHISLHVSLSEAEASFDSSRGPSFRTENSRIRESVVIVPSSSKFVSLRSLASLRMTVSAAGGGRGEGRGWCKKSTRTCRCVDPFNRNRIVVFIVA